jgi:hypothetical protein
VDVEGCGDIRELAASLKLVIPRSVDRGLIGAGDFRDPLIAASLKQ